MKKLIFLVSVISLFSISLFAEITVVNPVPGKFSNRQTLVIEANEGEEIYYSFSGSDPLSSGFAYDGPVLLDVTGDVELRVAAISKNYEQKEITISYSVAPAETQNTEHNPFISLLESAPVVEYVAGEKFTIPFTLSYAFGESRVFEKGKEISISKDSAVERYLPISLRDDANVWRYVMHIVPAELGQISQREVPFKIYDWDSLVFTDPKMIYSLDGSWWYNYADPIKVDRSVPNTIYYQSAEYKAGNPVSKIVLPPKPKLKVERQYGGAVKISVEEPLKISASLQAKTHFVANGLYSEILLDVFPGDKIDETLPIDVYSDGVCQGTLFAHVSLSRATPEAPTIRSNVNGVYARDNVQVIANAPKNLKLFVGISDAVEVPVMLDLENLPDIKFNEPIFSKYDGEVITFFADTEKILAYKVSFYSEDSLGVKSQTVSYSVVIDKYNYYIDAASKAEEQNGSPFAPYKDLSMLSKIVNKNEFSRFCIKGEVQMDAGEVSLNSNVEFYGTEGAKILMLENSVIIMKNAGLYVQNVAFEKTLKNEPSRKTRGAAKALTNMFILENSAATFDNCELRGKFSGDGTMLNLSLTVLSLNKTIIVNEAQGYSSVVTALSSKIKIENSKLMCISDTSVGVSVNGGSFELSDANLQVTARMARIAEFIDATVSLENNRFSAELAQQKTIGDLIYKTKNTKIVKDQGNVLK